MSEMFELPNTLHDEMKIKSALRDRKIYLNNEISREVVFEVIYLMNRIRDIDEVEGLDILDRKPIEIIINNYGGEIYAGLELISVIDSFKKQKYHIITTVSGIAMSMAFVIGLVGSERRAYKYARFMCHQPNSGMWGTLRDMEQYTDETKYLWNVMQDIITENSGITLHMLDIMYREKEDRYYSSEEALELSIIDKII